MIPCVSFGASMRTEIAITNATAVVSMINRAIPNWNRKLVATAVQSNLACLRNEKVLSGLFMDLIVRSSRDHVKDEELPVKAVVANRESTNYRSNLLPGFRSSMALSEYSMSKSRVELR